MASLQSQLESTGWGSPLDSSIEHTYDLDGELAHPPVTEIDRLEPGRLSRAAP